MSSAECSIPCPSLPALFLLGDVNFCFGMLVVVVLVVVEAEDGRGAEDDEGGRFQPPSKATPVHPNNKNEPALFTTTLNTLQGYRTLSLNTNPVFHCKEEIVL